MPDTVDILLPSEKGAPLTRAEGEAQWIKVEDALNGLFDGSKKAGNADKLDGFDSSDFARFVQMTGAVGNINSPLLHLPLKKNLLTQQGQSVCTFTRASAATYVDRYGMLKSVAADTPRFTTEGLLIEGASTNLLTYSEQFDNGAWVKTNASIAANTAAVTDPFGTNLADKLIEDASSGEHSAYQQCAYINGTTYCLSVFAQSAERTQLKIYSSGGAKGALFDLSNGSVVSYDSGVTASIQKLSNGWFRCSIVFTATVTATRANYFYSTVSGNTSYVGNGTSGLYLFGAQLEAMPFATSYIQTTTTSVTRAGNGLSVLQSDNFPSFSGNLSVCVDLSNLAKHSANQEILRDSSGFRLYYATEGLIAFAFGNKQITSAVLPGVFSGRITAVKSLTMLYLYINGLLVASTAIGTLAVNQTTMQIGSASGTSNYFYGTISNLRIYDRALTAEEVRLA
ncbi:LamG domain-containing protein [Seleniivibrio woodruffii]|uniref:LamG domain-containing protein n=1 Tax=Seleniivibrio woodruffii TaxID=1078050 RepID=UPI002409B312|nr:LamG domain-containing protein [Seleniivibrio woodruffii]